MLNLPATTCGTKSKLSAFLQINRLVVVLCKEYIAFDASSAAALRNSTSIPATKGNKSTRGNHLLVCYSSAFTLITFCAVWWIHHYSFKLLGQSEKNKYTHFLQ